MVIEALLRVVRFFLIALISLLPRFPTVRLDFLDGVFQLLSLTDLLIDVRVLAGCLATIILVYNIEFFWSIIMWVVRKIPGVN